MSPCSTPRPAAGAAVVVWRFVTYHAYLLAGGPVFLAMLGTALRRRERATARRPA
ncbi:hypothetical protein [Halomonas nitroreducens]|uniref:hypothetical protein n=1 Tax=Halomonas nitroreducens TaxID=447425 RepID=UPI001C8C33DE|nr:hypothetical protein [Halomonas nitroreducens]